MNDKGILIGIAGGTGSGKTLVAKNIFKELGSDRVVRVCQDSYYRDLSHIDMAERITHNFDHPDALDTDLLIEQMKALKSGRTVRQPVYDFVTHTRKSETIAVGPHRVIVLEGILIFDDPGLRDLMDIKVYVDTDADIRLLRRMRRDMLERGRTLDSVIEQYESSVRPMHIQFVEPCKRYADVIIPEGGHNRIAIDLITTKIESLLAESSEIDRETLRAV